MHRQPIESSVLAGVGYDQKRRLLEVKLVSELASEPMSQGDRERRHRACEGSS